MKSPMKSWTEYHWFLELDPMARMQVLTDHMSTFVLLGMGYFLMEWIVKTIIWRILGYLEFSVIVGMNMYMHFMIFKLMTGFIILMLNMEWAVYVIPLLLIDFFYKGLPVIRWVRLYLFSNC